MKLDEMKMNRTTMPL